MEAYPTVQSEETRNVVVLGSIPQKENDKSKDD